MAQRNLKVRYYGLFGLFGLFGFVNPLYFLFFLFFLFFFISPKSAGGGGSPTPELIKRQAQEKAEHLQKIKDYIATKDKVANDDIQKLLGVSDSTAQRYLEELVKNGIIKKEGSEGHTFYAK